MAQIGQVLGASRTTIYRALERGHDRPEKARPARRRRTRKTA